MCLKNFLMVLVLFFTAITYANSFCYEPSAPSTWSKPTKPVKPFVPFCVNEFSNTHTCDEWTINSYNSDVSYYNSQLQSYNYELEDYVRKLENYVNDAQDYANCEIRNLNY
jgi:hypothetical protein